MSDRWRITQTIDAVDRVETAIAAHIAGEGRWALVATRDGELCVIDLAHGQLTDRVALIDGERVLTEARFVADRDALCLEANAGASFDSAPESLRWIVFVANGGRLALERAAVSNDHVARAVTSAGASGPVTTALARANGFVVQTVCDSPWKSVYNKLEIRRESSGELLFPSQGSPPWNACVDARGSRVALSNGERIAVYDLATGALIAEHPIAAMLIEWASDDVSLFVRSRAMEFVLLTLTERGLVERWRITSGLAQGAWFDATLAPSGDRVLVAASGYLLLIDVRDASVTRVQNNFVAPRLAAPRFIDERECVVGGSLDLSLFSVDSLRFQRWITVDDLSFVIANVGPSGAIATREGAYALLRPGQPMIAVELDVDFSPGTLAARTASVFGVSAAATRVDVVRVDGVSMGSADFGPLASRESLDTYAMSADGTTIAVLTTHGRMLAAKYQGDPRSLIVEE